tara:strand:- start:113 stop:382 length:270 start_codon:yes stop_codon:yes gene_type:complete
MKDLVMMSLVISLLFFAMKVFEVKMIKKGEIDFKSLANESMYVLVAAGMAQFVMSQIGDMSGLSGLSSMIGGDGEAPSVPGAFTNEPEF